MLTLEKQNRYRERYRRQNPGWRPATERFAAETGALLGAESRVLDIGCGRGGLLEQLAHPLEYAVGLDPDWASLVSHRLPSLPRAAAWSDALPFAAGSFDLIFASWVLEHLARPEKTFAAIARVLRPGGFFLFITPNGFHPLAWGNRLLGGLGRLQGRLVEQLYGRAATDTFPTHYRANSYRRLAALARAAGLELIKLQAIPDPTYLAFSDWMFRLNCMLEGMLPTRWHIHLVGALRKEGTASSPPSPGPSIYPSSAADEV